MLPPLRLRPRAFVHRPAPRLGRPAVALTVGLAAVALRPLPAHADVVGCRSDPVVTLSNGVTLDLSATINDSASDVQQTLYVLHAPVGTQVVSVVGTDGLIGLTERFVFYADSTPNTYTTQTTVTTGSRGVGVTASTAVVGASGTTTASTSGQTPQTLPVSLTA